jgi:hypothetical protein
MCTTHMLSEVILNNFLLESVMRPGHEAHEGSHVVFVRPDINPRAHCVVSVLQCWLSPATAIYDVNFLFLVHNERS